MTDATEAVVQPEPTGPPDQPLAPPQPSIVRRIFVGKEGIRALWSFLIFILVFAILIGGVGLLRKKIQPSTQRSRGEITLKGGLVGEAVLALVTLLATWVMSKIERRGRSYGYGGPNRLKLFVSGLGWGVGLISLLVFSLWKGGFLVFESRLIFGPDILRYGFLWLISFCFVGVFEESLTRGFILYTLTRGLAGLYQWVFKTRYSTALGFWSAAVLLSVIFFLGHTNNPGESPVGLLSVFLAGMFFCLSVWRTGSLWWAIGMHAAWDWGQSFLFGVADSGLMAQHHLFATHPQGSALLSGGTTGPEGSIFVVAVLAIGSAVVLLTLPRGRYYEAPPAPVEPEPQPAIVVA